MADLQKSWTQPPKQSFSEAVGSAIRPEGALKPRIQGAIKTLQPQIRKLDRMSEVLQKRDAALFAKVTAAVQRNDSHASKVLGNELAEIRKVTKILSGARTALERIELRLSTCRDLGDAIVTIIPTVGLMRNIQSSLGRVMPGAEQELSQMADMLGGLLSQGVAGSDSEFGVDASTSAEAENILQEAAAVAGTAAGQMFPSAPSATGQSATEPAVSVPRNNS